MIQRQFLIVFMPFNEKFKSTRGPKKKLHKLIGLPILYISTQVFLRQYICCRNLHLVFGPMEKMQRNLSDELEHRKVNTIS